MSNIRLVTSKPVKRQLAWLLLPVLSILGTNANSAETIPNAGDILRQQQAPLAQPSLDREELFSLQPQQALPDSKPFYVGKITLIGNTAIATAELRPLIDPYQDKELTFQDLQKLTAAITQHYEQHDYLFSRAVVPQQTLKKGALKLQMIEATLGDISISNQSHAKSMFLRAILAQASSGEIIKQSRLNRALLLLKDVPGISVRTAIRAGTAQGQSDLRVSVENQKPKHQVNVNNMGSRQTNRLRMNGNFNWANLLGQGDLLGLSLTTSGELMTQGGLNYGIGLGDNSDRIGISFNHLDYKLGGNLKDLNAKGQASTAAAHWRHNWVRNLDRNVSSEVKLQRQSLDDQLNNGVSKTKRDVDTLSFSVSGDIRDAFFSNSISSGRISASIGQVTFNNSDAKLRDSQSANTQGGFSRINLDMQHRQALNPEFELSWRLSAQLAQDNLDSSQKQSATGPFAVRGYDTGGVSADNILLTSLELQRRFAQTKQGNFAFYGFIDAATAEVNQQQWAASTNANRTSLAAAGVGLRWQKKNWNGKGFVAAPIGNTPDSLAQSKTGVLWFQVGSDF